MLSRIKPTRRPHQPPLPWVGDRRRERWSRARPLNAAGQARVREFSPMAYRLAWRCARTRAVGVPIEELISEAFFGLTYAASMFRESMGVPFGAYATMVIRHRLAHLVRVWRREEAKPFSTVGPAGDGFVWEAADHRPSPDPAAREMCERVRRALPGRLFRVLRLHYVEGQTMDEVGAKLGVSRQRVRQLVRQALEQARERFPQWVANGASSA